MKNFPQARQFKVHPATILSLIGEQAGDPVKAISELVMNSVDAGAKNIYLAISSHEFSIIDDGVGFSSKEQIEKNFGTFGMPHDKGDATYGCFRMGRGQIFKLANTKWRSANFLMVVDINGKTDDLKYSLEDQEVFTEGCSISGYFYNPLNVHEEVRTPELFDKILESGLENLKVTYENAEKMLSSNAFLDRLLKFLFLVNGVNISINGQLLSDEFSNKPLYEDGILRLYSVKNISKTYSFNKGVYIEDDYDFPPLIVNYKESPDLNMARNQINHNCPVKMKGLITRRKFWFESLLNGAAWAFEVCKNKLKNYLIMEEDSNFKTMVDKKLNKENYRKFINLITVDVYKAGKIKRIGLIDFFEDFSVHSEKYLISSQTQCDRYSYLNKRDLINFFKENSVLKAVVFIPINASFEHIQSYLNASLQSFGLEIYNGEPVYHNLFDAYTEIKSATKDDLKFKSKKPIDADRAKFIKELSNKAGHDVSEYSSNALPKVLEAEKIANQFIQSITNAISEIYENEPPESFGNLIIFSAKKFEIKIIASQLYYPNKKIPLRYTDENTLISIIKDPNSPESIIENIIFTLMDDEDVTGWDHIKSSEDIEYTRDILNDKYIYTDLKRNKILNEIYAELSSNSSFEAMRLDFINQINKAMFVGRIRPDQIKRKEKEQMVSLLDSLPDDFKSKFKNLNKVKNIAL